MNEQIELIPQDNQVTGLTTEEFLSQATYYTGEDPALEEQARAEGEALDRATIKKYNLAAEDLILSYGKLYTRLGDKTSKEIDSDTEEGISLADLRECHAFNELIKKSAVVLKDGREVSQPQLDFTTKATLIREQIQPTSEENILEIIRQVMKAINKEYYLDITSELSGILPNVNYEDYSRCFEFLTYRVSKELRLLQALNGDMETAYKIIDSKVKTLFYPTKKKAESVTDVPNYLALFSSDNTRHSLTSFTDRNSFGYLVGYGDAQQITLNARGEIVYKAPKEELVIPDEVREFAYIPLSIIYEDFKKAGAFREEYTIHLNELANKMTGRKASEDSLNSALKLFRSLANLWGVFIEADGSKTLMQVANVSYNDRTKLVTFDSRYLKALMGKAENINRQIATAREQATDKERGKLPTPKPYMTQAISMSLEKERNKTAVQIVKQIRVTIDKAGNNTAHIKASNIVEHIPEFKDKLDSSDTKTKNRYLERAFKRALQILNEEEDRVGLRRDYGKAMQIPKVSPENIPTVKTLDTLVYKFPHEGKIVADKK